MNEGHITISLGGDNICTIPHPQPVYLSEWIQLYTPVQIGALLRQGVVAAYQRKADDLITAGYDLQEIANHLTTEWTPFSDLPKSQVSEAAELLKTMTPEQVQNAAQSAAGMQAYEQDFNATLQEAERPVQPQNFQPQVVYNGRPQVDPEPILQPVTPGLEFTNDPTTTPHIAPPPIHPTAVQQDPGEIEVLPPQLAPTPAVQLSPETVTAPGQVVTPVTPGGQPKPVTRFQELQEAAQTRSLTETELSEYQALQAQNAQALAASKGIVNSAERPRVMSRMQRQSDAGDNVRVPGS